MNPFKELEERARNYAMTTESYLEYLLTLEQDYEEKWSQLKKLLKN